MFCFKTGVRIVSKNYAYTRKQSAGVRMQKDGNLSEGICGVGEEGSVEGSAVRRSRSRVQREFRRKAGKPKKMN
jgi:hypothetical protein